MRKHLRLALPPLSQLTPDSPCAFALVDQRGALLRAGELPLKRIADEIPVEHLQVILPPGEAIVVSVTIPPLPAKRIEAAVCSSIEPMALSDIADLCVAHSPRAVDGNVSVAWAERRAIARLWELLASVGLDVAAIVPHELALAADDPNPQLPLAAPADARWLAPLPNWSLARAELRPAGQARRWHGSALWAGAAALVWLLGLQVYAAQQRQELQNLQRGMEQIVLDAFPHIPVVIAPLKQASDARDALRLNQGMAGEGDFMPIALAAARALAFADGHVRSLHYAEGRLMLTLGEGYTPPANETTLLQNAAAQQLVLEKDPKLAHTWHIQRAGDQPRGARP
ncbi:type II secretion system protein GspL [Thauera aromatica]|uniref:type II secretion system protein GspL n=1 Tax=Thauera aromatica TaxID=59405 RepID=UPI001FFD75F3|nr:type II secretion system protein GspL [Thauera aromatica]MCK2094558.1 type II secretion system protein GspL [Thauera aromatica]